MDEYKLIGKEVTINDNKAGLSGKPGKPLRVSDIISLLGQAASQK